MVTQSIRRNRQTSQNDQRENCKQHATDLHIQISLLLSRLSSRRSDLVKLILSNPCPHLNVFHVTKNVPCLIPFTFSHLSSK